MTTHGAPGCATCCTGSCTPAATPPACFCCWCFCCCQHTCVKAASAATLALRRSLLRSSARAQQWDLACLSQRQRAVVHAKIRATRAPALLHEVDTHPSPAHLPWTATRLPARRLPAQRRWTGRLPQPRAGWPASARLSGGQRGSQYLDVYANRAAAGGKQRRNGERGRAASQLLAQAAHPQR